MIVLAAVLGAASMAAGPVGDIRCVADGLGPELLGRIGTRIVEVVDSGESLDTALDSERDAFIAARDSCRTANKWKPDQTDMAVFYADASAALVGSQAALRVDGIDIATVGSSYESLSSVDRDSMVGGKSPSQEVKAAVDRIAATAKGPGSLRDKVIRHLTIYFSARSALDLYPARFGGG